MKSPANLGGTNGYKLSKFQASCYTAGNLTAGGEIITYQQVQFYMGDKILD